MRTAPSFRITGGCSGYLILRDIGPWNQFPTITNEVEFVLKHIRDNYANDHANNNKPKRVFYIDSEGQLNEIVHNHYTFVKFAPFPSTEELLTDKDITIRALGVALRKSQSSNKLKIIEQTAQEEQR